MARKRSEITEILKEMGSLKPADVQKANDEAAKTRKPLHEVVLELKLASEEEVTKALAMQYDMEYIDLDKSALAVSNVGLIPPDLIRKHQVLPLDKRDGVLRIVIGDPTDIDTIDALKFRLNTKIETCLAVKSKIQHQIDRMFSQEKASIDEAVRRVSSIDRGASMDRGQSIDIKSIGDDAPIIKLVSAIISEAVKSRASDIHIEPMKDRVRVRYRIDGVLRELMTQKISLQPAMVSRIKVMAKLDIAERRRPQDGRIPVCINGREIDVRVSTLPTTGGEKVVMRILDSANLVFDLEQLGFRQALIEKFKRMLDRPHGLLLVTGPTGSGKTTTLYSALQMVKSPEKNIVTIEDPVEYQLGMINQVQVNHQIDLTFAAVLRSVLRQDPNVIMLGEIRDNETARVAVEASLTGHLVLSTLHTNDSVGAITRLINIGVEPFLVANSVIGVVAQRLARKICPACRQPYSPPDEVRARLSLPNDGTIFYKGQGCNQCYNSGHRGRLGLYEVFEVGQDARKLMERAASAGELREARARAGETTLFQEGMMGAKAGQTSLEEVLRVAWAPAEEQG